MWRVAGALQEQYMAVISYYREITHTHHYNTVRDQEVEEEKSQKRRSEPTERLQETHSKHLNYINQPETFHKQTEMTV